GYGRSRWVRGYWPQEPRSYARGKTACSIGGGAPALEDRRDALPVAYSEELGVGLEDQARKGMHHVLRVLRRHRGPGRIEQAIRRRLPGLRADFPERAAPNFAAVVRLQRFAGGKLLQRTVVLEV